MNDRTPCATSEALVTYLYEECEPAERQSIAAHVAMCPLCAEEVRALGDTRAHLASWSPPALPLGFQITRIESEQPAKVLDFAGLASRSSKSGGRWSRPLPAWAQVAAAAVIFAAGMSVNAVRSSSEQPTRTAEAPATRPVAVRADAPTDDLRVTRAEFARLDARLRVMERADVSRASYVPASRPLDYDEMRARFSSLENQVAANEQLNLKRFSAVRDALNRTNQEVNQRATVMEEGQQELERAVRYTLNPSSLAVRTSLQTNGR